MSKKTRERKGILKNVNEDQNDTFDISRWFSERRINDLDCLKMDN